MDEKIKIINPSQFLNISFEKSLINLKKKYFCFFDARKLFFNYIDIFWKDINEADYVM